MRSSATGHQRTCLPCSSGRRGHWLRRRLRWRSSPRSTGQRGSFRLFAGPRGSQALGPAWFHPPPALPVTASCSSSLLVRRLGPSGFLARPAARLLRQPGSSGCLPHAAASTGNGGRFICVARLNRQSGGSGCLSHVASWSRRFGPARQGAPFNFRRIRLGGPSGRLAKRTGRLNRQPGQSGCRVHQQSGTLRLPDPSGNLGRRPH